ncbi:protein of unknown function [Candidatus Filomicrobium marinum]|uniref:Flagellar protein n=1 Tax=Candidatus Filomicrobium marinum TaxID=1608628 RepID=A0A0D6JJL7_9HYPH|nr:MULTISPECIES: DUF1217 domain-containing protein [Filomicrobium]MCV0371604.1 DUF1217 domain-containing protein [Filomicrobium sp.]CFX55226.1 protein of unknown function [Candidatus Filomicrobium marinum]CPR22179.1 protein of unknown function [Candidatus Filomicrobium marinum]
MLTTMAEYQRLTQDLDRTLKMTASDPVIARETEYYLSRISEISTVDEFVDDTRVFNYAMKAFGLEEMSYAKAFMRKVLTEGIDNPDAFSNKLVDKRYRAFAEAFNFQKLGAAATQIVAQETTTDYYTRRMLEEDSMESNYYLASIQSITTIDEFIGNTRVYSYAMKAFGLEDMIEDADFMRTVLTEGIHDPNAFANQLADSRFRKFAAVFNFESNGEATTSFSATQQGTVDKYMLTMGSKQEADTDYYLSTIADIKSIGEFMENTEVFNYALKAFFLEDFADDTDFIRKILEDGLDSVGGIIEQLEALDQKSLATFANAFNFRERGEDATTYSLTQQGTVDRYIRETLEVSAGEENQGVRLALYFERKAPSITSAYTILADKALTKFVQVALGIPASASSQDIDKQAAMIEKRLDLADLQDPEKLDKLVRRFTMLWELENPTQSAPVPNVLIGQPLQASFSSDLLASLQNLKLGGF